MSAPAPPQTPLRLAIAQAGPGALVFLATGRPGWAWQGRLALPADGLAPWTGRAWQQAADHAAFGAALAQALLPPALRAALAGAGGGPLLLLIDDALAHVPWELAVVGGQALDDGFETSRLVLADGADAAGAGHSLPGEYGAAPLCLRDDAAAAAAGRAGQPALALP
ncbi:MAG: hypothetical protein QE285_05915, partial [Aquabacterium sp.]|nr:hypothetical protein [Aquabacterium sp.]